MKEHPILFSGEMVRAILEGKKTQTRRVIKSTGTVSPVQSSWEEWEPGIFGSCATDGTTAIIKCPYGSPGDRLWVRETWAKVWNGETCLHPDKPCKGTICEGCHVEYKADSGDPYPGEWPPEEVCDETPRWKPSIHMPRWASRITLEVLNVRVERVQEITAADCWAEGIRRLEDPSTPLQKSSRALDDFHMLWDSINAKRGYSWESNPFVWVVEFKLLEAQ